MITLLILNNIEWYKKISYASDKNYFIDDTVKQNITNRKDENIDIHKLENVLRITNLLYGDNEFEIDLNKNGNWKKFIKWSKTKNFIV